jgi:hypothetical protein
MGFALVAFLITVIFICNLLSCAGHVMCQRNNCRFQNQTCDRSCPQVSSSADYRFARELSSTIIGHDIMGFALVAFLITVIFICNLLSFAGHVMCQRNNCRFKN